MILYIGKCLLIEEGEGKKKEKVLVIGDIHIGASGGQIGGIDIAGEMEKEMLSELDEVFEKIKELSAKDVGDRNMGVKDGKISSDGRDGVKDSDEKIVDKVVLLGDLKHEFSSLTAEEMHGLVNLFDFLQKKSKEIIVIRGNHDNYLLNILSRRGIKVWDYYLWNRFCFLHGDRSFDAIWDKKIKHWIMGHLHPAICLREGTKTERYKCFLVGKFKEKEIIIVPSFAEIGEGMDVGEGESNLAWKFPLQEFDVKIVGEKMEVLDFGNIKNLK